jgi:hypothetical protein
LKCLSARSRRPSPAVLVLLAAILAPAGTGAQSALSCDATIGWSGLLREGRWSPIIVSVENLGPAIEGRLSVEVASGSELLGTRVTRTFGLDVGLPARSRRRFPVIVPVSPGTRSALVQVTAATGSGALVVLCSRQLDLREATVNERIVVVVSGELSLDSLATALSADGAPARVVYPHPETLPDASAGWDAVDLAVIRDTSFHRLRSSQVEALRSWVADGGILVLAGGTAIPQVASPGLDALSPVAVTGLAELTGLPSLARLARTQAPRGRLVIATALARAGAAVLASEGDLPIVATRRLGDGTVAFLAFDPADRLMSEWPGGGALWRMLAEPAGDRRSVDLEARDPFEDAWIAPLTADIGFAFPSLGIVVGFTGGYLALVALLLVVPWFRPSRRPAFAALGLVVLSIAATAAAWALFERSVFRGGAISLEATIVRAVPGEGLGLVERRLAVFATVATTASVAVGSPAAMVEEIPALRSLSSVKPGERAVGDFEVAIGTRAVLRDLPLGRYSSRMFSVREVVPFDMGGSLDRSALGDSGGKEADTEGDGSAVTVRAPSDQALRDVFLLLDGKAAGLGDIPAGEIATRRIGGGGDLLIADPVRRAFWERVGPALAAGGPTIVAWMDGPPGMAARGKPPLAGLCLVVMRLP